MQNIENNFNNAKELFYDSEYTKAEKIFTQIIEQSQLLTVVYNLNPQSEKYVNYAAYFAHALVYICFCKIMQAREKISQNNYNFAMQQITQVEQQYAQAKNTIAMLNKIIPENYNLNTNLQYNDYLKNITALANQLEHQYNTTMYKILCAQALYFSNKNINGSLDNYINHFNDVKDNYQILINFLYQHKKQTQLKKCLIHLTNYYVKMAEYINNQANITDSAKIKLEAFKFIFQICEEAFSINKKFNRINYEFIFKAEEIIFNILNVCKQLSKSEPSFYIGIAFAKIMLKNLTQIDVANKDPFESSKHKDNIANAATKLFNLTKQQEFKVLADKYSHHKSGLVL